MKKLALLSSAAIVGLYTTSVYAQVIPGSASPDIRQRQLEIKDKNPTVSGKPIITVNDGDKSKQVKSGIAFTLHSVTIEGNTVYKNGELEQFYKELIGTKITVSRLNKIADDITSYYRNNGYILTRAVLPPQAISGGNVKIRVVEGFVSAVKVQGDDVANDDLIKSYAENIRQSKPLDVATLERYLLLMEDLPGVEARAVLQPSPTVKGASEVIINIKRKQFEGSSASFDNRGSRFLGPEQLTATGAINNAFGLDEQTQLRVVTTALEPRELWFSELRHEEQLGDEGTKAVFSGSYVHTNPQHTLTPFDVQGHSVALSAGLSHPLLRSRRENWFANTDFTFRNSALDSLSSPLSYDKTRVLSVGTSYDFVDFLSAINRAELKYGRGMDLGTKVEDKPRSRANGEPVFDKVTGKVSRIQPITGPFSAYFAASGQWSPDTLVASEEFALGGADFGSAYDSAELTGDSGAAGRFELQYNEAPQMDWLAQYQIYAFYDGGAVWNRFPIPGSEASRSTLTDTGLGARFNVNEQFSGGIEGALPLTRDVAANGTDGRSPRIFFNVQYRY